MRLWSLHPSLLDSKGLVALWREGLLAKKCLEGKTKGYTNHPQLNRFKACSDPLRAINIYLNNVWIEAKNRGYNFDKSKLDSTLISGSYFLTLNVTKDQINYEYTHLQAKLLKRDLKKYLENTRLTELFVHILFRKIDGPIESWEKI